MSSCEPSGDQLIGSLLKRLRLGPSENGAAGAGVSWVVVPSGCNR